ncbi:7452_t:CDS:10 [Diversispora eburnea]|uniref:Disintegrin and metalloproteinase domain-containing protein B n=1 Tax=Diversispora eburnea TaxID=1213867 RepID=A0A9N9BI81_9GLOM|nr:7452_t:CDS:10 [Diversispora eburnea]
MENPWFNFGMKIPKIRKRGELFQRAVSGCPLSRKIAYMGAVADCTYAARTQILKDWTTASAVYEASFNVTLGLIKIEIQDQTCPTTVNQSIPWNRPCSTDYSINTRLSDFSKWRGTLGNDGAALWHLMSKCNTDSKVGVAWLGQLCQYSSSQNSGDQSYVSGTGVSTITKDEWKVVAHEIGHGFASYCPCINCAECCPLNSTTCDADGQFIMNPTNICELISTSSGSCLVDPSDSTKTIISEAMCGNGLKESGEECDCGTAEECVNDPCCDGNTCKLKSGALCDDKNDMCCENCKYKSANTTCRPAISECDIVESCDGKSGICPTDQYKDDGVSCGSGNGLACASGQCTSRDDQCITKGTKLGVTKACSLNAGNGNDCALRCASPIESTTCYELTGNFIDGTPCGFGGKCSDGKCVNMSSWFDQNKKIVIPIGIVLGFLISLCLAQCLYKGCRRRHRKIRVTSDTSPGYSPRGYSQGYNNLNDSNNDSQWVDPTPYNGPTPASSPTQELPDYYHSGVSNPPYGHNDRRNLPHSPYSHNHSPDIIPPYSYYETEPPSRVNSPAPTIASLKPKGL